MLHYLQLLPQLQLQLRLRLRLQLRLRLPPPRSSPRAGVARRAHTTTTVRRAGAATAPIRAAGAAAAGCRARAPARRTPAVAAAPPPASTAQCPWKQLMRSRRNLLLLRDQQGGDSRMFQRTGRTGALRGRGLLLLLLHRQQRSPVRALRHPSAIGSIALRRTASRLRMVRSLLKKRRTMSSRCPSDRGAAVVQSRRSSWA